MDVDKRKKSDELVLHANRKLKILYEAGKKLGATLDVTELYNSMYEYVSLIADCDDMFVAVYNETEKLIKYSYLRSKEEEQNIDVSKIPPIPLAPPGFGILSEVIRSGESKLFNDYQNSFKKSKVQYTVGRKGELTQPGADGSEPERKPRSAMLVPIKLDNNVFAVVQIFSLMENAYSAEQLELVESLMHQVALANKNVLLYKQAQDEILERIKAEMELKKSEERFSLSFKLSPVPISLIRLSDDTYIDVNDKYSELLGYRRNEILGKGTLDLKIWDREARYKTIEYLKKNESFIDLELKLKNKNGEFRDVLGTAKTINIRGEKCVLTMLVDITEKKKADELLRELSRAVEQSPASIVITDTKGDIEYVNPKFTEITGYNFDEVFGENPRILKSGETKNETYIELWNTISSGNEWHGELHNKKKNGELFWEWASISPIYDNEGVITSYVAIKEDITERKIIQQQIQFQAILMENITDAIIYTDTNHVIKSWNYAAAELYGWKAEEILNKKGPEYLRSEYLDTDQESVLKTINENGNWTGELIEYKKNGKPVNILASYSFVKDSNGMLAGYLSVNRDITILKNAEEKIKASLKEKEILLKEIHHRVKNNLQVISSLLKMQAGYIKDPLALDYFKISAQRVKSMALIHEQLYRSADLSKIDFEIYIKKLTTHLFQTFGVNPRSIGINIKVKNVKLSIDTAIPCGLLVNELVSNSLKHGFTAGRKGTIEIKMEKCKEENYILSVKDNGVGFPENVDFRNTETLGLQLINTLTEQVEGNIELKQDSGTEFIITFKASDYKKRI